MIDIVVGERSGETVLEYARDADMEAHGHGAVKDKQAMGPGDKVRMRCDMAGGYRMEDTDMVFERSLEAAEAVLDAECYSHSVADVETALQLVCTADPTYR